MGDTPLLEENDKEKDKKGARADSEVKSSNKRPRETKSVSKKKDRD